MCGNTCRVAPSGSIPTWNGIRETPWRSVNLSIVNSQLSIAPIGSKARTKDQHNGPLTIDDGQLTMDTVAIRTLTSQLAEDLGWLEGHCRRQPEQSRQVGKLRLAAALVRNVIGPFLGDQPPRPLHIAVVG